MVTQMSQAAVLRAWKQVLGPATSIATGSQGRLLSSSSLIAELRCRRSRTGRALKTLSYVGGGPRVHSHRLKPSKKTHRPSRERDRSGRLASSDPHLPLANAEQRTSLLQPVSISCTDSSGMREQLGRRTSTQQTFPPGPSRPQENSIQA